MADRDSDSNNMVGVRIRGGRAEAARDYIQELVDGCGDGLRLATQAKRPEPEPFVQIDWQNVAKECVSLLVFNNVF